MLSGAKGFRFEGVAPRHRLLGVTSSETYVALLGLLRRVAVEAFPSGDLESARLSGSFRIGGTGEESGVPKLQAWPRRSCDEGASRCAARDRRKPGEVVGGFHVATGIRRQKRGDYFSSAARIGQFAQGSARVPAGSTWDLAFRGARRDLLEISRQVWRVQRPLRGLHSISS